jgi:hypothetical protein
MKKTNSFFLAFFLLAGAAWAGPHPHGLFPKHKPSGKVFQVHHNPHKLGGGSFHAASGQPGSK